MGFTESQVVRDVGEGTGEAGFRSSLLIHSFFSRPIEPGQCSENHSFGRREIFGLLSSYLRYKYSPPAAVSKPGNKQVLTREYLWLFRAAIPPFVSASPIRRQVRKRLSTKGAKFEILPPSEFPKEISFSFAEYFAR